jgi:hypothetical protein
MKKISWVAIVAEKLAIELATVEYPDLLELEFGQN